VEQRTETVGTGNSHLLACDLDVSPHAIHKETHREATWHEPYVVAFLRTSQDSLAHTVVAWELDWDEHTVDSHTEKLLDMSASGLVAGLGVEEGAFRLLDTVHSSRD